MQVCFKKRVANRDLARGINNFLKVEDNLRRLLPTPKPNYLQ